MSSIFEKTSVVTSIRGIPRRALIVNDDRATLDAISSLLTSQQIDVAQSENGEEALTLLARQWFPLVITDDQMPRMDGIELTQRIRALAVKPSYVIMLTSMANGNDIERGYCAGVDIYVPAKGWETSLASRVADGLTAIRLRSGAKPKLANYGVVTVDLQSGAHTARHLVGRLNAEIMLAKRREATINIAVLGVHPAPNSYSRNNTLSDEQLGAVMGALRSAINPKCDWVAWLHQVGEIHRFLVVLPGPHSDTIAWHQALSNAFVMSGGSTAVSPPPKLSFGTASFAATSDATPPTALEFLGRAESARRAGKDSVAAGLGALQRGGE
jgi:CheY-like chemotaxis protein